RCAISVSLNPGETRLSGCPDFGLANGTPVILAPSWPIAPVVAKATAIAKVNIRAAIGFICVLPPEDDEVFAHVLSPKKVAVLYCSRVIVRLKLGERRCARSCRLCRVCGLPLQINRTTLRHVPKYHPAVEFAVSKWEKCAYNTPRYADKGGTARG